MLHGFEVFEVALDGLRGAPHGGDRVGGGMVCRRGGGANNEAYVRASLSESNGAGGTDAWR